MELESVLESLSEEGFECFWHKLPNLLGSKITNDKVLNLNICITDYFSKFHYLCKCVSCNKVYGCNLLITSCYLWANGSQCSNVWRACWQGFGVHIVLRNGWIFFWKAWHHIEKTFKRREKSYSFDFLHLHMLAGILWVFYYICSLNLQSNLLLNQTNKE